MPHMHNQNLSPYWMPFTANRQFKAQPRLMASADGMYYRDVAGREILDGTSGLWCCNAGHNNPRIVRAIQEQAATLDFAPPFQMSHPAAFELAERLIALPPSDNNKPAYGNVFFCNSGSEAVDTALKIALAYHRLRGEGGRTRLIGRERGYHGVGFGGISVGGIVSNRKQFGMLLAGVDHMRHTHDLARNAFSHGLPHHGAELADDLERMVALHDASTIAAVIVEPVACSAGVLVPPRGYLERLREICTRHGILLIFDEVITGYGRLGAAFGANRFAVTPDMICMAKGLTNGAVPMGGVIVRDGIYQAFMDAAPEDSIELFHGYTYSGHPLACAAALATLDVYRDDDLFARAASLEPTWEAGLHALKGSRHVIDIRNFGLIGALELEPIAGKPGARGFDVYRRCFERGVLVRATGDIIALSPPLIIEKPQIARIFETLSDALKDAA